MLDFHCFSLNFQMKTLQGEKAVEADRASHASDQSNSDGSDSGFTEISKTNSSVTYGKLLFYML